MLHNVHISNFADLKKAITMEQVLDLATTTRGVFQSQLPAPYINVPHEEYPMQGLFGREHVKERFFMVCGLA